MYEEEKKIWIKFACAALANSISTLERRIDDWNDIVHDPKDMIDEDEQISEDCEHAAQYADKMLSLFYDKYEGC